MPIDRYLYVNNFWPQPNGEMRLRDGYSLYAQGLEQDVPIHSIVGVVGPGPDYKRLIVYWQDKTPYVLDPATKAISTPLVSGLPIQSAERFCYFYTNGHLHAFNGTDAKWFDGAVWRDIGLPKPNAASIAAMTIVESVREFSASEAAAVTLTLAGGGTFPADKIGRTFYCALYDLDQQEIGPATIPIGPSAGFKKFALNQELQVAVLPSVSGAHPRWVKLPALTGDGDNNAKFVTTSSRQITGGAIANQSFSLAAASASNDPTHFPLPSFSGALSAADLSGGPATATVTGSEQSIPDAALPASLRLTVMGEESTADTDRGRIVYDRGTIGITITGTNNFQVTLLVSYNAASTAASLATALAASINKGGFFSAVVAGTAITVTPTVKGGGNVYTVGTPFAHTLLPEYFADGESFTLSKSLSQFGQRTIYDSGTLTLLVNSDAAVVAYGPNDTQESIALFLAAAINGLNSGVKATALANVVNIAVTDAGFFVDLNVVNSGLSADDVVGISNSGDSAFDGQLFTAISVTGNTVRIFAPLATLAITSGTVQTLLAITAAGTTATITTPTFFLPYRVNDLRGIPGSAIGGTQPGFQFYGSLYMRAAGGHVGNRIQIGQRLAPATRTNVRLIGTILFAEDEQELLLGRTADGAELPYAMTDKDGTWLSVRGNSGIVEITDSDIDGDAELPARNFPPPGVLDFNDQIFPDRPVAGSFKRAWVESDHCCGTLEGSPTIYRSGSAQDIREGKFVGLPEQSWAPQDIETFPTAAPVTCGQSYQEESLVYSRADSGVLVELAAELGWQGPWNIGAAGQFAYTRGWKSLPFVLTGEKQLATTGTDGPMPISDEYEAALLSKIGDEYLGETEILYVRKPHKRVEALRICARDASGAPLTIIHDFNLRDERSPYGQAYQETFLGLLAPQVLLSGAAVGLVRAGSLVSTAFIYDLGEGGVIPSVPIGAPLAVTNAEDVGFNGSFEVTSAVISRPNPFNAFIRLLTISWEQAGSDATTAGDLAIISPLIPTFAVVRDENDLPQVLAGAPDGNLYLLYDGISDNGEYFTGDALALKYVGPQRSVIKHIEWYGDANAKFFIAKKLTTPASTSEMEALCPEDQNTPDEVQDDAGSNHWIVPVIDDLEMRHAYVWLKLTGYEGGTMELNDPPHMPVETYGRVMLVSPSAGASRPK